MSKAGEKPCPSCPFLPWNHGEFKVIADRLCAKAGKPPPDFWERLSIRESVVKDALATRRLLCHSTVYDEAMNLRPEAEHKPCIGLFQQLNGTLRTPLPK